MHHIKISSTLLLVTILFSCKKDNPQNQEQQADSITNVVTKLPKLPPIFEPATTSTESLGTIAFNTDTFNVTKEYTDGIAYIQDVKDANNNPNVLNYREALVHFISKKTGDTITINRTFFKKHIPDYDKMILQGVHFNFKLKNRVVPLLIYFCQPDTDYCYHFDMHLTPAGKIKLNEINEDDFEENEQ